LAGVLADFFAAFAGDFFALAADFLTGFFRGLVPCSNGNL